MNDAFNPKRLALPPYTPKLRTDNKPPRHRTGEKFLKGPVPWVWVTRAANMPGKALHVAFVLWFLAGVKKIRTVSLSGATLRELGVKRHAGYRGLTALERAGLVHVERHPGRNPIVTLLDVV